MNPKILLYNYTFLILSVLMLIFCAYNLYSKPLYYAIDFTIINTNSIAKLEPSFLKKLDEEIPLPAPEPMYSSESDEITSCGGWSERIVLSVDKFSKKELFRYSR